MLFSFLEECFCIVFCGSPIEWHMLLLERHSCRCMLQIPLWMTAWFVVIREEFCWFLLSDDYQRLNCCICGFSVHVVVWETLMQVVFWSFLLSLLIHEYCYFLIDVDVAQIPGSLCEISDYIFDLELHMLDVWTDNKLLLCFRMQLFVAHLCLCTTLSSLVCWQRTCQRIWCMIVL